MSWARLAAAAALLMLAGCGFRPLHGQHATADEPVVADFSQIAIATIADRRGQMVRNELLDLLTPRGEPANARYVLNVGLSETVEDDMILRTGAASRSRLTLRASYQLREGDKVVNTGTARTILSYDLPPDQPFAAVTSERDAERQAAQSVAEQIKSRLAVYFARQQTQ